MGNRDPSKAGGFVVIRQWRGLRFSRVLLAGAIAALAGFSVAQAQEAKEPTAEQIEFFEKKIRPVLVDKCYSCHSHQTKKVKSEYYLDSREGIRKGGESGEPAIVPGHPEKSPLIKMIRRDDPDAAMPPKKADALSKAQVKDFEEWVKQGAPDPRKEPDKSEPGKKKSASAESAGFDPAAREHWAFKNPVEPVVPAVKNSSWVESP